MPLCMGLTPIRDDSSSDIRSLSKNEKMFVISSILKYQLRCDGRELNETRPLILTLHRADGISECTIQIGQTKVLSVISCELISPQNSDRPNEGCINIKVDLSPMACMGFYVGAEQDKSQRIHRILERVLRERASGALDTESLCVLSGIAVWKLHVTITVLDDDGNIVDASLLSALAALRHLRLPETQILSEERVEVFNDEERDPVPLPLHHTPIPVSFALLADNDTSNRMEYIVDPNQREELLCHGFLTFCFNKHAELCCIDFSAGMCPLNSSQLKNCAFLAQLKVKELSDILENALEAADQNWIEHRLQRMQGKLAESSSQITPPSVPYWEEMKGIEIEVNDNILQQQQENIDRLKALDFDHLHQAASVMDHSPKNNVKVKHSSSLLQAMVQSTDKNTKVNQKPELSTNVAMNIPNTSVSNTTSSKLSQSTVEKDSDDEEDVMILQSEFTPAQPRESSYNKDDDTMTVNDIIQSVKKAKKKNKKKN